MRLHTSVSAHAFTLPLALALLGLPRLSHAAEDDRGHRGWFVAGGGGAVMGQAIDKEGRRPDAFYGTGGHFRFGEEVIDRLTLGLDFGGAGGSGKDYDIGAGGFALQATYRPGVLSEGFVLLGGTGLGAGAFTPAKGVTDPHEGSGGGAFFQLGLSYELDFFGRPDEGVCFAPYLRWQFVPATDDAHVQISAFVLGIEVPYYAGR